MNQQKEFLMVDAFEKRQGANYENQPKMFSSYFKNIKELRGFLTFADYVHCNNPTETLGIAYKILQARRR